MRSILTPWHDMLSFIADEVMRVKKFNFLLTVFERAGRVVECLSSKWMIVGLNPQRSDAWLLDSIWGSNPQMVP